MTGADDAAANLARLREEVVSTRKRRMDAQRAAIAAPVVALALDRASRDRSSRATDETDAMRDEIDELWDQIVQEGRQVDGVRQLFRRARRRLPGSPVEATPRGCPERGSGLARSACCRRSSRRPSSGTPARRGDS